MEARGQEHRQPMDARDTLLVIDKEIGEVVITGERTGVSLNAVGNRLSSPEIRNALGTSLTALLERVSGVSSISTGTTVSQPVIQGMYGNRILIINNGARQTGQQWGIDHAPKWT